MKKLVLLLSLILLAPNICFGQSSAFTYQGKLASSGAPANGDYQFEFKLFDSDLAGNQVGTTQTVVASVQNGIFTTQLDFGAASFPADAGRWLEISVRPNGSTDAYTVLSPRQQINSVPFAIRSLRSSEADNAASLGGVPLSDFVQTNDARLSDARPPAPGNGNYIQNSVVQQAANISISGNAIIGGTLTARNLIGDGSGLTNIRSSFVWQVVPGGAQQAQSNIGYIVSNSSQATITLPGTPSVGDVVRVSSANSGGWKIVQNVGQSIVTGNLGLLGTSWTAHESARAWSAIASSADGSKLVAVVNAGLIYTSTDTGLSWTPMSVAGIRNWSGVASSADGTKLVAVVGIPNGHGGQIYTSTDAGVTWTARATNRSWASVASSSDGSKLVAVVSSGLIYTSTDSGVSWTPRESSRDWTSVASSSDGVKLVATVSGNSGGQIYTSTDSGVTWTPHGDNNSWRAVASSADGTKLVAVAGQKLKHSTPGIYTSTDAGVSWTQRETARNWIAVASSGDGNKLIAADNGGQIYLSDDSGVTWAVYESNRGWAAVASSTDGTRLAAVVNSGQIFTSSGSSSATTTIGTVGDLVGGPSAAIELQYIGNGVWIPLSHEGTIIGH